MPTGVSSAARCCIATAVPLSFVSPRYDRVIPDLSSHEERECKAGRCHSCHLKCPLLAPGDTERCPAPCWPQMSPVCPTAGDTRQGDHKARPGMSLAPRHRVQHLRVSVAVSPSPARTGCTPRSRVRVRWECSRVQTPSLSRTGLGYKHSPCPAQPRVPHSPAMQTLSVSLTTPCPSRAATWPCHTPCHACQRALSPPRSRLYPHAQPGTAHPAGRGQRHPAGAGGRE